MSVAEKRSNMTVLCCLGAAAADPLQPVTDDERRSAAPSSAQPILDACAGMPIHLVGPRPGKAIDPLLAGDVLVVGDDADLNAVVLRLLRRDLLATVAIGYASPVPTPVTRRHQLPTGAAAVATARNSEVDLVPLVRNDAGGVLVGLAQLAPVTGTFYVDEERVPGGSATVISVEPDHHNGVAVTVVRRRFLGFGRQPRTYFGRAAEFGIVPGSNTEIVYDGIRHPREVKQWVFYRHTAPLRLIRGLY